MSIMANRIFLSLTLLCITATTIIPLVDSEQTSGLCEMCQRNHPEGLASPWYDRPVVYGNPITDDYNNLENQPQRSSNSEREIFPKSTPNPYRNPFYREPDNISRCPNGRCNIRTPRNDVKKVRLSSNLFEPRTIKNLENKESTTRDYRLKTIELPSQKKLFMIYQAHAEPPIDRILSYGRSPKDTDNSSSTTNIITDQQLEEIVRRTVVELTEHNIRNKIHSGLHRRREINDNNHEPHEQKFYNAPTERLNSYLLPNEDEIENNRELSNRDNNNRDGDDYYDAKEMDHETAINYRTHSRTGQNNKENDNISRQITGINRDRVADMDSSIGVDLNFSSPQNFNPPWNN